jgi:phospholipid/cholesterol/gamma-HCH transport system permease protein
MTPRAYWFTPYQEYLTEVFAFFGALANLLVETLSYIMRGAVSYKHTVRQMAEIGVGSLMVAILTVGFSGAVAALYISIQLVKYGQPGLIGGVVGKSLALEIAPVITAIVVAARSGSAMAAELGSMTVTEQVDALRSLATSPIQYLVVPRVLATLIMLPLITVIANAAGVFGGYIASTTNGVSATQFMVSFQAYTYVSDQTNGLLKTIPFALLISLIGCRQGLATTGGAQGVGKATTSAVVFAMIAVYIMDFFLSTFLQDVNLHIS